MNFKAKLLAYHAIAAAIAVIPMQSVASDIDIKYEKFPLTSPEAQQIWAAESNDATPLGEEKPWAMIAKVKVPGKKDLVVSQLFSSMHCGGMECPIKIMQEGKVINEGMACDAYEYHELSDDHEALMACDAIIPLDLK